jgi:hypothetical protein
MKEEIEELDYYQNNANRKKNKKNSPLYEIYNNQILIYSKLNNISNNNYILNVYLIKKKILNSKQRINNIKSMSIIQINFKNYN